jgi:hypothetical protein
MKLSSKIIAVSSLLLLSATNLYATERLVTPINETDFVVLLAGKTAEFVKQSLGEPEQISSKNNDSGTVEFWLYKDIVSMGKKGKTFKYTQIGIINDHVETLGNTNRQAN